MMEIEGIIQFLQEYWVLIALVMVGLWIFKKVVRFSKQMLRLWLFAEFGLGGFGAIGLILWIIDALNGFLQ